ncbi:MULTISPECIES: hypothetical protein [unclassified Kitasatospora]|uniref:hypothetical protein n=1 Tax=unclassified Kitasatospora TaxID=2633591 RepID=UPI000709CD45|nr:MULTISPECIES: hypothetical protein [unclassified Kitasatospora]KQV14541.1 hypothetical protein ASC99_30735 [Kitasatospora sp. Root107]KRB68080.1 hypothetical protein ASE03_29455 [Kitasatospora sp. Root187]
MAGIRVVVCLPAAAREDLGTALGQAMAPFEMFANPQWRFIWDSWTVRGGSDGSGFSVLPGFQDSSQLIHDDPRYDGTPLPSQAGMCAGGPRGMLDMTDFRALSKTMATVRAGAGGPWDLWHRLAPEHPPLLPWSTFQARHLDDPQGYPAERVLADYTAQPLLQAFAADPLSQIPGHREILWLRNQVGLVGALDGERSDFERRMVSHVYQPDILTLDGWWIEDGTMPIHGLCEDEDTCPHMRDGWHRQQDIGGYLDALADDVLLIKLRCHG